MSGLDWLSPLSAQQMRADILRWAPATTALLDVGCGRGELLAALANDSYQLHGCDIDQTRLAAARLACPTAELCPAAAESLPWPNASFGVITLGCVLSLADTAAALAEAARLLAPGGVALAWDLFADSAPAQRTQPQLYTEREWYALAQAAALQVIASFDYSRQLRCFVGQLLLDGVEEACAVADLRPYRPGYQLLVLRRVPHA